MDGSNSHGLEASQPLLVLSSVSKHFGGVVAVSGLDLAVTSREIRGLIGPNGSGKSTVLNLISGVYRPTSGRIAFKDEPITNQKASQLLKKGIARTFQNARLFRRLNVLENVMVARYCRTRAGVLESCIRTPRVRAEERETEEIAMEFLSFVGLSDKADYYPGELPYGQQRLLEIARALASEPVLLLLDEPAAGMTREEKNGLKELIRRINEESGIAIILVEHDMHLVMDICRRLTVLNFGEKIAEGTPGEVKTDERVIEAYLGRMEGRP